MNVHFHDTLLPMHDIHHLPKPHLSQLTPAINRGRRKISGLLLATLFGLAIPAFAGELEDYPDVGPAPPLALADLGGKTHSLADYRGQVVLLNFWATWCPPCLVEMPAMQRLKDTFPGTTFTILAVNVKETREKAWRFQQLVNVNFTVLLDKAGIAAQDWHVSMYPTSYLIDKTGRIRYVAYGTPAWESAEVKQLIQALLEPGDSQPVADAQ